MIDHEYIKRLKSLRVMRGWTQHDLARQAGVSRGLISSIEAGYIPATDDARQKVQAAFGIDPLGEDAEAAFSVLTAANGDQGRRSRCG